MNAPRYSAWHAVQQQQESFCQLSQPHTVHPAPSGQIQMLLHHSPGAQNTCSLPTFCNGLIDLLGIAILASQHIHTSSVVSIRCIHSPGHVHSLQQGAVYTMCCIQVDDGGANGVDERFLANQTSQRFGADLANQQKGKLKSGDDDLSAKLPLSQRRAKYDNVKAKHSAQ